jgi:hypothetical protein
MTTARMNVGAKSAAAISRKRSASRITMALPFLCRLTPALSDRTPTAHGALRRKIAAAPERAARRRVHGSLQRVVRRLMIEAVMHCCCIPSPTAF